MKLLNMIIEASHMFLTSSSCQGNVSLWSVKTQIMKRSITSNSLFAAENGSISERSRQMIFSKVQ